MSTVFIGNRPKPLERFLKRTPGPLRYLRLQDRPEPPELVDRVRREPEAQELAVAELFRERSEDFRKKYVEFMGQVNVNNHSLHWWTMPFTNKYSLTTQLCRNAFNFLLIVDLVQTGGPPLLVLTDSVDLAEQMKRWGEKTGTQVINAVSTPRGPGDLLRRYTPAGAVKAVALTVMLWILSRRYRPTRNRSDSHLLITTHTHSRSFPDSGGYQDAYFGALMDRVADSQEPAIVLGLLYEEPFRQIRKLRNLDYPVRVVPVESCLTLLALISCAWHAFSRYLRPFHPQGPVEIGGQDIGFFLTQAIKETLHSGEFFLNLKVFYSARWLTQTLSTARCLYPCENRSWEKMLVLGVGSASPDTRIVGYQHTSITLHHTNFLFGDNEAEITPLPPAILTCGEVTKNWLEDEGNYPPGIFTVACALRQELSPQAKMKDGHRPITNVLAALGTSLDEYLGVAEFLQAAFEGSTGYSVRVRPHPNLAKLSLAPSSLYSISTEPLADDLEWADVILYSSSTVSLQAIHLGTPAIYLDLGNFLDTDPMFGWSDFKWTVTKPGCLIQTMRAIDSMPDDAFQTLRSQGREYVISHLSPVTEASVQAFWEA